MKKQKIQTQTKGFTLIGVLVALSIAIVAQIAVVQLMSRAEKITDTGRDQFVATGIAREGLELVRAVRDTNWYQQRANPGDDIPWLTHGLCETQDRDFGDAHTFTIDIATVQNRDSVDDNVKPEQLWIDEGTGRWLHENSGDAKETPYSRTVTVTCEHKDVSKDEEEKQAVATVTSTVTWQRNGQAKEVQVQEKIFNWLPIAINEQ